MYEVLSSYSIRSREYHMPQCLGLHCVIHMELYGVLVDALQILESVLVL